MPGGNQTRPLAMYILEWRRKENPMGRGILLWLLGVPIPIIIIILLFWH